MAADIKELVHPLVVRVTHWINVVAVLLMIASGWRIYNADPIFDFSFPDELTLGGWLAGALQWHFAAVWLLVLNGLVYVCYGIISGHFRRKLLPISPLAVLRDLRDALRGRDRKSTRLNSSHITISYAVFCLKKKKTETSEITSIIY